MAFILFMSLVFCSQALCVETEDEKSLLLVEKLIENIKKDETNGSFRQMIADKVMSEHTLARHGKNQPYFYSNDPYVITDIINLALEGPDGIIDETATTGLLKVYREFNHHEEIEELFDREKRPPGKFQKNYLGQTIYGPTNKVVVILKIKGDEQTQDTLEKRLVYSRNNVRYVDAYPIKAPLPLAEDQAFDAKPEDNPAPEGEKKDTLPVSF